MAVRRKFSGKTWALCTALMVLTALVVPFTGSAVATHGAAADPTAITVTPATDRAQTGTCNPFTVTATSNGQPAEGETIDVRATQADADTIRDLQIAFCDPDAGGPGTNLGGAQGASGPNVQVDCDDDAGTNVGAENAGPCPAPAQNTGFENPAIIHDEGFTNQNGQFTFGITSNEPGTMNVTVFFDVNNNNQLDPGEGVFGNATKTWVAGGQNAARNITCQPAIDQNPEGSRHEFQCTVTDQAGAPVQGVQVSFDVTAGPNAEEIGPQQCGANTNAQGQTTAANPNATPTTQTAGACGYNDFTGINSPPGTDTITVFVNQTTGTTGTAGPDPGEPQTTIRKQWFGPARTLDCEPETATNAPGTTHVVTCTVTDVSGGPVPNQFIRVTETGPGTFAAGQDCTVQQGAFPSGNACFVRTDANGQAQVRVTTAQSETGTQTLIAELTNNVGQTAEQQPGLQECEQPAGTTTAGEPAGSVRPQAGATAGVCRDDVQKVWAPGGATAPPTATPTAPPTPTPTAPPTPTATPPGKVRVDSTVTIRYDADDNAFKGQVASSRPRCQRNRTVVLKKAARGPDRVIGQDTTNRAGNWKIRKNRAYGRFRAVVRRTSFVTRNGTLVVCLRDASPTIKLRRG